MKYIRALFATFCLLGVFIIGNAKPPVGEIAPTFEMKTTSGKVFNLSDQKGKIVVLEWTNHQCPFVVKHYSQGNMQQLQRDFTGKGIVWVRVISSAPGKQGFVSVDENENIVKENGIKSSDTILDPQGMLGRLYEATNTPEFFIINKDGKIVYAGAIDSVRSTNAGDIAASNNYVKMALEDLLAGRPVRIPQTKPYGCSVKY